MTIPVKTCATCGARAHLQAEKCASCGHEFASLYPAAQQYAPAQGEAPMQGSVVQSPPGYPQAGSQPPLPGQHPYPGVMQPHPAQWAAPKSKVTAGLLALLVGWTGAHGFYLGNMPMGFIILAIWVLAIPLLFAGIGFILLPAAGLLCFVQSIIYFTSSEADFHRKYVVEKRWL